ncbi:nucleotidyl transferase AbiEii/AbiGii toxin family protein [Gemmatimonas sp.]|uniref:nucleotidyl transferase AbiEii/AbiGii toxin family protein n=1 Tax=Gemmatimonas sp. TaxID=1962908 RepID=UPI003DA3DB9B
MSNPPEFPAHFEGQSSATYTPEALVTCLRVLGTLVKAVGAQHHGRLVVIGGLVPRLLFNEQSLDSLFAHSAHPGTNDVDLCIELDVPDGDDDFYQCLEESLRRFQFERAKVKNRDGQSLWRWQRTIEGITVLVEFLTNDDAVAENTNGGRVGRLAHNETSKPGDEIGALRIRGAHLALIDPEQRSIEVELLDNNGKATVTVRVANLLAFVVLKSFAVHGRLKNKDSFDLVWVLTHYADGPVAAARDARAMRSAHHEDVGEAMRLLKAEFETVDHTGCVRYANFVHGSESAGTERYVRACRDAHGAVNAFLDVWFEEANRPIE